MARVHEVPGFGWQSFAPAALAHPVVVGEPDGPVSLSNGLVTVEIDATVGTFSLDGKGGYGQLVDGGDLGDSYNYSPPRRDALVEAPESVSVRVIERGPVRASAGITASTSGPITWTGRRRHGWASIGSRSRPSSSSGPMSRWCG